MHDVHTAHPDRIPALEAQIADISTRRVNTAAFAQKAAASLAKAKAGLDGVSAGIAAGKLHDPAALSAIRQSALDAEGNIAMAENSLNMLGTEHDKAHALLVQSQKMKALADHAAAISAARQLGAVADERAAAFNEAYTAWRDAMQLADLKWPAHIPRHTLQTTFPSQGPGLVGARAVHPEIVGAIAQMGGFMPERGKIEHFG